jgi:hypothetical protein
MANQQYQTPEEIISPESAVEKKAPSPPPPEPSAFSSIMRGFGNRVSRKIFKRAGETLKKVATKVAARVGIGTAATAAGVAAGPVGWASIAAGLAKKAAKWIATKIGIGLKSLFSPKASEENKKLRWAAWAAAFFGGIGLIQAGLTGIGSILSTIGGLGAVGELALSAQAIGTATASVGQTILAGLTSTMVSGLGIPAIAGLVATPIVIAIILFIINSGAYVTPKYDVFIGAMDSPYIGVEKKVEPDCLNRSGCPGLPGTVTYEITVTAKKSSLTNISFDNQYMVLGDGSISDLPPIPQLDVPDFISPAQPYTTSYRLTLGSALDDSIVFDTLVVTADVPEESGARASAVASVIIGNPPAVDCPIVGAHITYPSYDGTKDNIYYQGGHGSNAYWGSYSCNYDIPYSSGAWGPTSVADPDNDNKCRTMGSLRNYYGYAADFQRAGAGDPVQTPSIFGKSVNWTKQRQFSNNGGAWGYGVTYTGSDSDGNNYFIYFTHLNYNDFPSQAPSGTLIGTLSGNLSNPHVHVELSINGQWVMPDFLCGGKGP